MVVREEAVDEGEPMGPWGELRRRLPSTRRRGSLHRGGSRRPCACSRSTKQWRSAGMALLHSTSTWRIKGRVVVVRLSRAWWDVLFTLSMDFRCELLFLSVSHFGTQF